MLNWTSLALSPSGTGIIRCAFLERSLPAMSNKILGSALRAGTSSIRGAGSGTAARRQTAIRCAATAAAPSRPGEDGDTHRHPHRHTERQRGRGVGWLEETER